MKTLFLLLLPIFSFAQPKFQAVIDGGLTSSLTITGRAGVQMFVMRGAVIDGSFRYTQGSEGDYFVESATFGYNKDFERTRLIITAGPYFHQYNIQGKSGVNHFRFGGQVLMQYGVGICGFEWNGNFATVSVGFAFGNHKAPETCVY